MRPLTRLEDFGENGTESLYRCSVCHTHWLYQLDKWQACLGFKLWSGDLHSYRTQDRFSRMAPDQIGLQKAFRGPLTH